MKKNNLLNILVFSAIVVSVFFVMKQTIFAADSTPQQDALKYLQVGSNSAGFTEPPEDPRKIAVKVINIFLGLVGSIFVYLIVYSGYLLLNSRGESDKVEKAKKTIFGAMAGLVVILLAYSITNFVGTKSQEIINNDGSGPQMYEPK